MIWIDTFELNGCPPPATTSHSPSGLKERSNVHVVSYRRVRDAHRLYGQDASWIPGAVSLIAPLQNIGCAAGVSVRVRACVSAGVNACVHAVS